VKGTDVRGPVAEEADRHLARAAVLSRPCGADRDRQVRADDGVRAHHPVLHAGQVHRAALAAHQRALPADQLEEDGRHRHPAGESVVVPAVGAERVVVVAHGGREPRGHRLLPDAEVRRAAHEPREEQLVGALLEQPALDHDPVHPQAEVAVEVGRWGGCGIGHQ
jgi:hypothetical protein